MDWMVSGKVVVLDKKEDIPWQACEMIAHPFIIADYSTNNMHSCGLWSVIASTNL